MNKIKVRVCEDPPKDWNPKSTEAINKWFNYIHQQNYVIQSNSNKIQDK